MLVKVRGMVRLVWAWALKNSPGSWTGSKSRLRASTGVEGTLLGFNPTEGRPSSFPTSPLQVHFIPETPKSTDLKNPPKNCFEGQLSQQCSHGFLEKLDLAVEDGDLRLLSTPLVWVCLWLATSVPSWNSCRRKHDLFMRVKRGRIGTNRANNENLKKANRKVIQFASHFAYAYPDYSIQWICRHEFSGVFIGKAYKEIWQSLHREWINFRKLCVLPICFYTPQ